jgi:hypothetical protein
MKGHVQHGAAGTPEDFSHWRVTTDTLTGKRFRWNHTVVYAGHTVPARTTARSATWLHPSRVRPALLAALNPPDPRAAWVASGMVGNCPLCGEASGFHDDDGTCDAPDTVDLAERRAVAIGDIGPTSTATTLGEPRADVAAATMPNACTKCGTPTAHTEDWTLWPWPDGAWLCSTCNDQRHEVEEYP